MWNDLSANWHTHISLSPPALRWCRSEVWRRPSHWRTSPLCLVPLSCPSLTLHNKVLEVTDVLLQLQLLTVHIMTNSENCTADEQESTTWESSELSVWFSKPLWTKHTTGWAMKLCSTWTCVFHKVSFGGFLFWTDGNTKTFHSHFYQQPADKPSSEEMQSLYNDLNTAVMEVHSAASKDSKVEMTVRSHQGLFNQCFCRAEFKPFEPAQQ